MVFCRLTLVYLELERRAARRGDWDAFLFGNFVKEIEFDRLVDSLTRMVAFKCGLRGTDRDSVLLQPVSISADRGGFPLSTSPFKVRADQLLHGNRIILTTFRTNAMIMRVSRTTFFPVAMDQE